METNKLKSIGEDVAQYIGTAMLGKLADSSKEATKTFNGFYERLRYQREFDLISEEEYFARLEELRDRYLQKGTDNWIRITKMIYSYQKKVIEAEKKEYRNLYDDISEYALDKLNDILKKQQSLADNLNSFGSLFNVNTVNMNGFTDHYYSLHDLSADIEAIDRYSRDMNMIRDRIDSLNLSEDAGSYLLSRIKEMDVSDALPFMGALLNADDKTFSEYTGKVFEKYNLSEKVSFSQYEDEFNKGVADSFAYMTEKLTEMGLEIPEGFYVSGSISAQKFGEAFVLELGNQMGMIRDVIDGFNIGLGTNLNLSGDTYNTTNTSYNINSANGQDTVEMIKRYETVKRLAGIS